jgi:hypothetical protein
MPTLIALIKNGLGILKIFGNILYIHGCATSLKIPRAEPEEI